MVSKADILTSKNQPDVKHKSSYTRGIRQHFLALVSHAEIPVGYARNNLSLEERDQVRLKPTCSTTEVTKKLGNWDIATTGVILSWKQRY